MWRLSLSKKASMICIVFCVAGMASEFGVRGYPTIKL